MWWSLIVLFYLIFVELATCDQSCSFQFIEEPPSLSFCDPTTFQPELTLGCAVMSNLNDPFPDIQWFVDQGAGPIPLSGSTNDVRKNDVRRTVGATVSLRQPFQPGRYFCQPKLLSNNSFLQPSQVFELKALSTYAGLLPCRVNDTLSVYTSRCADLYAPRSVCTTSSVPMVTNVVVNSDIGGGSICAGISATILILMLLAVILVNIIVCYLYSRKSRTVAEIKGADDHELPTSHRASRNSANSTYYAYPEVPQSDRTRTVPSSFEHEASSDSYHTPYSLSLPPPPPLPPSPLSPSQYASLRGVTEYSQHYTSLLSSNRIANNQRDSDVSYI